MKQILHFAFLAMFLVACDSGGRVEQTKALSTEIKASQIKRVTNTQLVYSANEWGKKIAEIAEKSLSKQLAATPEKGAEFCKNIDQIPVIAALQKEYGVRVELLGANDLKNPDLAPKEKEILDAYLYNAKIKAPASENLQQLNDTLLVYNLPLSPDSPVCRKCMTAQDSSFAVWRLLFNKKDIIRKLDAKQLQK